MTVSDHNRINIKHLINIIFLVLPISMEAQPLGEPLVVHNCNVYQGYLSGDLNVWRKGIEQLEGKYKISTSSEDLYALILSKYGYIGFIVGMKKDVDTREILSSTESNVELLSADKRYTSSALAMEGGLIAMKISLNPMRAPFLGMKSLSLIEKSIEADKNNPAAWVEMGNARYHMPSIAGGSYKGAVENFSHALTLFETDQAGLRCNWYYLHTLVWLARSHENTGNVAEAKKIYEKLLKMEPEFLWVKQELYPDLLKKGGF